MGITGGVETHAKDPEATRNAGEDDYEGEADDDAIRHTHLVLLGLMGSGKSTVGRQVADAVQRPFVDSDALVKLHYGVEPIEIEQRRDIDALHAAELDVARRALGHNLAVVFAAASSVVESLDDDDLRRACTVWLDVEPEVLAARVRPGRRRPLLGDHPLETLTEQYEGTRRDAGRRCDVWLEVSDADVDEVCALVVDSWLTWAGADARQVRRWTSR